MNSKFKNFCLLILSLAIPLFIGYIGSLLTMPSISGWYAGLIKPVFTPASWVFGPAWTILYVLMGVALFLVIKDGGGRNYYRASIISFATQLFLNLYWSFLFFYIKEPSLAFYAIISLWSMIIVNIYYFYQVKKTAALLLIPYIIWVTFAAVLNYSIWYLNI